MYRSTTFSQLIVSPTELNNSGKPMPTVCRFVRHLAKDMIMTVGKDVSRVSLSIVGLP